MITFKINGRTVEATDGSYILSATSALGLDIPALCAYPSLEPHGACRLCIVEVTHPDWPGWRKLVTSCNYPISEGLEVHTNTPLVKAHLKELLRLLLARCPETELVQRVARRYGGITDTPYIKREAKTDCILCDMCVRVCAERSTSALAHKGRGADREVHSPTDDCVGCGACALICPTQCIPFDCGNTRTKIWEREFPVAYCVIDPDKCRACGMCEEKCYFDVARVKLFATGRMVSFIDKASCQGCGSCAAACPTGAITTPAFSEAAILANIRGMAQGSARVVAFACPRSPIPERLAGNVIILPCIGWVSLPMIFAAIFAGARKVVLIGRDAVSCYFGEGERQAQQRSEFANRLLRFLRIGDSMVQVIPATPGLHGPAQEIERILSAKYPASKFEAKPIELAEPGYDALASRLREICESGVALDFSEWAAGLGAVPRAETALYVNRILVLEHLTASLTGGFHLRDYVAAAIRAMASASMPCSIIASGAGCFSDGAPQQACLAGIKASGAKRVVTLCVESAVSLAKALPDTEVISLDEFMAGLARKSARPLWKLKVAHSSGLPTPELPGVEWAQLPADMPTHSPFTFRLTSERQREYAKALVGAAKLGAGYILCQCPEEYLQLKLLLREGAWRMTNVNPVTPASLACILLEGGEDEQ